MNSRARSRRLRWLLATLLLLFFLVDCLAAWVATPENPRRSPLGRVYARMHFTTTAAEVEAMVGRPPDNSDAPPRTPCVEDDEQNFAPVPFKVKPIQESWRDEDKRLVVYYYNRSDPIIAKKFYCRPAGLDDEDVWMRLVKWLQKKSG